MPRVFTLILCSFISLHLTDAQVVINEFSAANRDGIVDNYGEREDWIELHNPGSITADISGWYLSDKIDNPTKWQIPAGTTIVPGGFRIFFASGLDEVSGGNLHTSFKITQTKNEAVILTDADGTIVDSYIITVPNQNNHSYARNPDGSGPWGVSVNPTPAGENSETFSHYAEPVLMSQDAGFYTQAVTVALTSAEPNSEIRYTLDGADPTETSPVYDAPIAVENTTVVRARAYGTEGVALPGFINTNTFFINETHTVKVISISGTGTDELLGGDFNEPIGSLELFEEDGSFIDEAVGEFNKHGNDSWAYAQRGIDYIVRDQFGYKDDLDDEIFDLKERNDYQRLIIKAAANDNYPFEDGGAHIRDAYVHTLSQLADMELDERTYEPCIMYLNGEYWGVYELREKADDHDYTKEYYNQGKKWIDFIKTWGGTWEEYGSWDDWYSLHDFITSNDMSVQENYEIAKEGLNMQSLTDYMIINTHIVCADWLNWNTAWWRGRKPDGQAKQWRYALWDMDASFGHYINYTGVPDTGSDADPCDNEEITPGGDPEGHVDLIQSLLQNEEFHSLYVNRYADLNNSWFSCEASLGLLDDMIARIEPEMPRQIERWGGTMVEWQNNVQQLRDFIEARCTIVDDGIGDCYEVEGPFPLTVNVEPAGSPNAVQVNTFIPESFPFAGDYFGGSTLTFAAVPAEGWIFDHWQVANTEFGPDAAAEAIQLSIAEDEEITAWFVPEVPCADPADFTHEANFTYVNLDWNGLFSTLSYEFRYRAAGSGEEWNIQSLTESEVTLYGLTECTDYEAQVRAICPSAVSEFTDYPFSTACSTDTENTELVLEFTAFPNPFTDEFAVDVVLSGAQDALLEVYGTDGRKILRKELSGLQAGQNTVQVTFDREPAEGVYIVQLITGEGAKICQIIKS